MAEFVINQDDRAAFGLDMDVASKIAEEWLATPESRLERADVVLCSLCSCLGQGTVIDGVLDYEDMERRIRTGIDKIMSVEAERRQRAERRLDDAVRALGVLTTEIARNPLLMDNISLANYEAAVQVEADYEALPYNR